MRRFRQLAVLTTVTTLVLIAWGGVVRATGSGDGCPDWPRCFGRWVPRLEYHTLIEYIHRLLAVVSGTARGGARGHGGRRAPAGPAWRRPRDPSIGGLGRDRPAGAVRGPGGPRRQGGQQRARSPRAHVPSRDGDGRARRARRGNRDGHRRQRRRTPLERLRAARGGRGGIDPRVAAGRNLRAGRGRRTRLPRLAVDGRPPRAVVRTDGSARDVRAPAARLAGDRARRMGRRAREDDDPPFRTARSMVDDRGGPVRGAGPHRGPQRLDRARHGPESRARRRLGADLGLDRGAHGRRETRRGRLDGRCGGARDRSHRRAGGAAPRRGPGLRRAHEAADHRAPADHDRARHGPGRRFDPVALAHRSPRSWGARSPPARRTRSTCTSTATSTR